MTIPSQPKPADRSLFYSFLLLLLWLPLPLGSNRVWSASLLVGLVALLCSRWCYLFAQQRSALTSTFYRARWVVLLFILANAWVGYQEWAGISIDPNATQLQWLLSWSYLGIFVLTLLLLNSHQRIKHTLVVLIISGTFQALYGSLMTLSGAEYSFFIPKDSYTGVATGTFINRNHLAGYLVICLSLGLGLMLATLHTSRSGNWRNRLRRWLTALLGNKARLRVALIIMVVGLVLTHSRMGNTAFFASMLITGALALVLYRNASRATLIFLSSLLIIDLLIVGTYFGVEKVVNRLQNTSTQSESRDEVDLYSLKLVSEHTLTGTGAGTFYTAFPQVREGDIRIFYDHAHNDYLEFLTERGIIGFIPLLLAVVMSAGAALQGLRKRRDPLLRGLGFGSFMSILAMAIHATVDFNLQIPANAATFMLVLALGWVANSYKTRHTPAHAQQHQSALSTEIG